MPEINIESPHNAASKNKHSEHRLGKTGGGLMRTARPFSSAGCLLLLVLMTVVVEAQNPNPPYLSQFPAVERVKNEIKGSDPIDTSARQVGALWQLMEMIKKLAGPRAQRNEFTRDEDRVKGQYFNAWQRFGYRENEPPPQHKPRWYKLREFYENDPQFRDELLQKLFPPEFRSAFRAGTLVPAPPAATAVLSAVSGLANQPGAGKNPLGGSPVILMKESFSEFLRKNGMFQSPPGSSEKVSPLAAWAYSCRTQAMRQLCTETLYEAQPLFVSAAKMDTEGKITFPVVPPGSYYLLTQGIANNQHLVWDLKVDLKAGANSVTLDQSNITPLDAAQAQAKASAGGATQPAVKTAESRPAAPAAPRPSGPKNSVLSLRAISAPGKPFGRTNFYLLDDDAENIFRRAGVKPQMLLGKEQPLLNSYELIKRWKYEKDNNPLVTIFEGMSGESVFDFDLDGQYALGVNAIAEHLVANVTTDIYGRASFPAVPAGTYYVYGTASEFVKTGARGTASGGTVTLHDTGYQQATIWNLKVAVKPGQNTVTLTPDNAAFTGN